MDEAKNDIYMGRKTNFLAQKKRCLKLLESGYTEVFLHGLGASVDRTVNLALELKLELDPLLEVSAKTGTLTMTDELRKVNGDASSEFGSRYCSVIHIRVFKNSCFVNSVDSKDLSDVAVTLRKK